MDAENAAANESAKTDKLANQLDEKKEMKEEDKIEELCTSVGEIKVKVNRFDSVDVTDAVATAVKPPADETDAKKIKEFFTKHSEEPHKDAEVFGDVKVFGGEKQELSVEEGQLLAATTIREDDVYHVTSGARGVCLIFENDMFHTGLGLAKRKGSSLDRILMANTFRRLRLEVRVHQNLTCKEIQDTLEAVGMDDHTKASLMVVVVLSHGNEGIFYGYDGAYPAHKVWQPFTADRCPSLAGKPKLFFIQACQGNRMDKGAEVVQQTGRRESTDSFASYRTPLHADFLLAHSTVAGYYSWRNTSNGSWFIQVLGWALQANHGTEDLATIMAKVGQVVAREYESNSSRTEYNHKKQTPFVYSTLTNRLFLK